MRLFVNPKDHENAAQRRIVAQESYASSEKPTEGGAADGAQMAASSSTFDRSFPMQVWILFLREMVLRKRSAVAFQATIGRIIMFGIILGATFPNVEVDNMVVFSLQGVLFFSVFMQFFDMVMAQVNSIPFLMEIYIREFRSGCYRLSAFYVAKNLS